jgi:hypothetical protein
VREGVDNCQLIHGWRAAGSQISSRPGETLFYETLTPEMPQCGDRVDGQQVHAGLPLTPMCNCLHEWWACRTSQQNKEAPELFAKWGANKICRTASNRHASQRSRLRTRTLIAPSNGY